MRRVNRSTWGLSLGFLFIVVYFHPSASGQVTDQGEEAEGLTSTEVSSESRRKPMGAVQAKFFVKDNRWEVFPHFYAGVLNNSYANRFLVLSGIGVSYHASESFFLEGVVDFFPSFPRETYDDLKSLTRQLAERVEVGDEIPVVPEESMVASIGIGFSPVYGKINLVSYYVQNFDISVVGGAALLRIHMDHYQVTGFDEYGHAEITGPLAPRVTESFASGSLGLSIRFFLTRWLTLRTDARLYGYIDSDVVDYSNPYVENGVTRYPLKSVFRNSFILAVGLSSFWPRQ